MVIGVRTFQWVYANRIKIGTCTQKKDAELETILRLFSTKSTFSGGINRIYDEIPHAWDEIRLDGGWVDLISSKLGLDFICHRQISSRSDFIIAYL